MDTNQLEGTLPKLAANALGAMATGGRLTIETANVVVNDRRAAAKRGLEPGEYVKLAVTDSGAGMNQAVIERAFDPFFTTKPVGQGTGLGLSMIYGFVKQSRGAIEIESRVGRGTSVSLLLSRSPAVSVEAGHEDAAEQPGC